LFRSFESNTRHQELKSSKALVEACDQDFRRQTISESCLQRASKFDLCSISPHASEIKEFCMHRLNAFNFKDLQAEHQIRMVNSSRDYFLSEAMFWGRRTRKVNSLSPIPSKKREILGITPRVECSR
jgi:hypothetical protein